MVARPIAADAPVVLFMPAHNEEEAVEACIERVLGRSRSSLNQGRRRLLRSTAKRAEASGAEVIRLGDNQVWEQQFELALKSVSNAGLPQWCSAMRMVNTRPRNYTTLWLQFDGEADT